MEALYIERTFSVDNYEIIQQLCGEEDKYLRMVSDALCVSITSRGSMLRVSGEEKAAEDAVSAFSAMVKMLAAGNTLTEQLVEFCISANSENREKTIASSSGSQMLMYSHGRTIRPRTAGQIRYCDAMKSNTVVLAVGPAGTGKTYLAVAKAVAAFDKKEVQRIVLTRPAVEAGEKLGYLPGDLQQKIDPYLRPLYDALRDIYGQEACARQIEKGNIEIAPLAYMRGRTLEDSFIILDEAQNTTREQMKMFLTRIGFRSKVVITGDVTQIDLANRTNSGLLQAVRLLRNIDGIATVTFDETDVVRNKIVKEIIKAYRAEEN